MANKTQMAKWLKVAEAQMRREMKVLTEKGRIEMVQLLDKEYEELRTTIIDLERADIKIKQ